MSENELPIKVHISSNVMAQDVEDEIILLHVETEEYYSLDDVGTTMWKLLEEKQVVADIIVDLMEIYDADEVNIRSDLAKLINQLVEKKLITVEDD